MERGANFIRGAIAVDRETYAIASSYRRIVGTGARRLTIAALAAAVVFALLVARQGTMRARVIAGLSIGLVVVASVAWALIARRRLTTPDQVLARLVAPVDEERALRALRALSLLDANGDAKADGTSADLARAHVKRTFDALPEELVLGRARNVARGVNIAAMALGIAALGVGLVRAFSVLEGFDVLFARHGIAPIELRYLDPLEVRARPPEYLHEDERRKTARMNMALPRGTLLTFRGTAIHPGRDLFLTDGASEVPFVDDGAGRLVARWPLASSVQLRILARFGDVVVFEDEATDVTSIADEAPVVKLEGAPRSISLSVIEEGGEIPIRYDATDDHGLREVHLVLRSGAREERRVLARLDGETHSDRGGHVLRVRDPFIKKSRVPVEVRVEAKDNDVVTGPKWGSSSSLTLVPPDVGEAEVKRMEALRKLRDKLVDSLSSRMSHEVPAEAAQKSAFVRELRAGMEGDARALESTLNTSYAGIRVPARLAAMLRGQLRKLRAAVDKEAATPSSATHGAVVKASETFALVADSVVRGTGFKDTRDLAKQLAEVADDLVLGATQAPRNETQEKERGSARMDAAVTVLGGGSRSMVKLGTLGRDIGGIVAADLSRVGRARSAKDIYHAELAARDLAARLHQPDPSFGAQGRSGHGGGESGGGRGPPGDDESSPDEAGEAFHEAAQDLDKLTQDHADEMAKTEQALGNGLSEDEMKELREAAKEHAEAIREAAKGLPSVGAGSDSWTGKGTASREHADQMARSLEQGNAADAVQSGQNALNALEEARRLAARDRWMGDDTATERKLEAIRKKLDAEQKWAEEQLDKLKKSAASRASKKLEKGGEAEEKLAERARELAEKGRGEGAMPQAAVEALDDAEKAAHEAARALQKGDADKALERQREAQRKLEMAKQQLGQPQDEGKGSDADDAPPSSDHADIPKADAHKGPEEFRKRVMKGLGQPSSGRLKDAVRRYAEGLLR